jgi:DNA primase small subunit
MGNENSEKAVDLSGTLHPLLRQAYDQLEPFFISTVASEEGQGILCDEAKWTKLLDMVPHPGIRDKLLAAWARKSDESTAEDKWQQLKNMVEEVLQKQVKKRTKTDGGEDAKALSSCLRQIVFFYLYPRLDVNVSKARNHLLKSPWCVHPKTGRVCVPFDPATVEDFNPETVPSLASLSDEINAYDSKHGADASAATEDFKKTSMKPIVEYFEKAFLKPMSMTIRSEFREKTERAAAVSGDW